MQADRTAPAGIDVEAVVRAVFQASDQAKGLGHTAELHIRRTVAQLRSNREAAAALTAAFSAGAE